MKIHQWKSNQTKVIVEGLIVIGVICIILANPVRAYSKGSTNSKSKSHHDQLAEETSFGSRSPRADANYMRNYHYPTRGESNAWDDGRQLSSFGVNSLLSSAGSSPAADYAYGGGVGPDPSDNYVAAGGHGHSSHGHGGGGGGGHGHGHGKDCNSALGLLGVLGLASYLQNVLRQMSTTAAPAAGGGGGGGGGGRRNKRDLAGGYGSTESLDVTAQILPYLMAIGHVKESNISVKCAYRPICLANKALTANLGEMAGPVTLQLSTAIGRMLTNTTSSHQTVKDIKDAGKAGRDGKRCERLYRHCPELNRLPDASSRLASLL